MKINKIIILTFTFILLLTISTFATEEPTRHTISIEVPANEEVVMPYIWGDGSYSPIGGLSTVTTASFVVPDNNFAFETSARDINGNACSARYSVSLNQTVINSNVATLYHDADGTTSKLDWISTDPDYSYRFKITNYSSTTLAVYIVYYSWN